MRGFRTFERKKKKKKIFLTTQHLKPNFDPALNSIVILNQSNLTSLIYLFFYSTSKLYSALPCSPNPNPPTLPT